MTKLKQTDIQKHSLLITILAVMQSGCLSMLPYEVVEPQWIDEPVQIALKGGPKCRMEFSPDGSLLCVAWDSFETDNITFTIYDAKGKIVSNTTNKDGILPDKYRALFPKIALRSSEGIDLRVGGEENLWNSKRSILGDIPHSGGWVFSPDYKYVLCLSNLEVKNNEWGRRESWDVEYWQLEPVRKKLWTTRIEDDQEQIRSSGFFNCNGEQYVFFNFYLSNGYILRTKDGTVLRKVYYGKTETDEEIAQKMKRYNLKEKDKPFWTGRLHFTPSSFSFCPSKRLLACGDFQSRRWRIISVDSPYETIYLKHDDANPMSESNLWYDGGFWDVTRIEFAGDRFLIVDTGAGARGMWKPIASVYRTDIYRIDNWERVWMESAHSISNVILSADGKKIAFFRNKMIEYGNFDSLSNEGVNVLKKNKEGK